MIYTLLIIYNSFNKSEIRISFSKGTGSRRSIDFLRARVESALKYRRPAARRYFEDMHSISHLSK